MTDLPEQIPSSDGSDLDFPSLIDRARADKHRNDDRMPVQTIIDHLTGFGALLAFAELRVADYLADGPRTADELAEACGADRHALRRVLAALKLMDIVTGDETGHYELTRAGATLISTRPDSMRPAVLVRGQEYWLRATASMPDTVVNGTSAVAQERGPLYEYLEQNPRTAALFDEYMATRVKPIADALADQPRIFEPAHTVVDLGGGRGILLATLLQAYPHLNGVLQERETVVPAARKVINEYGVTDRCEIVCADFFQEVARGDVYVLSSITHNWGDEHVIALLRRVASAMADVGQTDAGRPPLLLILDAVLGPDASPYAVYLDTHMMAMFEHGRERTLSEFEHLASQAGLDIFDTCPLPHGLSLLLATVKK